MLKKQVKKASKASRRQLSIEFTGKAKSIRRNIGENCCPRCGAPGFTNTCRFVCKSCGYMPSCDG